MMLKYLFLFMFKTLLDLPDFFAFIDSIKDYVDMFLEEEEDIFYMGVTNLLTNLRQRMIVKRIIFCKMG